MSEPPVTIAAYHLSPGSNTPVTRIVIHTTSPPNVPFPTASANGKARQTALYFTLASSGGSAQYVVDVAHEEHCLRDNQIAWHAPPNPHSIGIEICGQAFYTRAQWLSGEVWPAVERARLRALELSQRHGVPWVRLTPADVKRGQRGLCGHADVSKAFGQTDHTDPGPNFPWDRFMAEAPPDPGGSLPVVDFPEDHMQRIPIQLPSTSGGAGWWVLDGNAGDGTPGGPSRPAIKFTQWTGSAPGINGQYHHAPGAPVSVTVCESDGGFAEVGFSGFPPGSAPLVFLPIGS